MASIRKRGDAWQVQVRKQGRRSVTETFKIRANALAWARKVESEIERGLIGPNFRQSTSVTLSELIERYIASVTPKKKSRIQETNRLRKLSKLSFSNTCVANVTTEVIARFRDQRLSEVGSQAVRHDLNALSQVFATAIDEWGIGLTGNPIERVRKPPPSLARQRRLSESEATAIAKCLNGNCNPDFKDMILIALGTAMRKGEILRIQPLHIISARRLLSIPETKNGHPRTIPLSAQSLDILRRRAKDIEGRLFPFDESWCRFHWNKLLRIAGIVDLHFHDLRHEAVTQFFEMGLTIPEVALISGHKDYRMLARYTHLRPEDIANKLWAGSDPPPTAPVTSHQPVARTDNVIAINRKGR